MVGLSLGGVGAPNLGHSNAAGLGSAASAKPDIIYLSLGSHGGRAFSRAAFERGSKIDVSGEYFISVSSFMKAEKTRLQGNPA